MFIIYLIPDPFFYLVINTSTRWCCHVHKRHIFNSYGQTPPSHLSFPSSLTHLISSLLFPFPHHSIPPHFIVRWGFARQKVTEMSLTYTLTLSLGLCPFSPHILPVLSLSPPLSFSHENAYIIKCLFFFATPLYFLFPNRISLFMALSPLL